MPEDDRPTDATDDGDGQRESGDGDPPGDGGESGGTRGEADDAGTTIAEDGIPVEGPSGRAADIEDLREDLDDLRERVEERTVPREDLEGELRRYVRWRVRRGHARGWGPYLVLLYGTVMTLGAFYYLGSWAAVAAMVVIWLSTLGLYVLMLGVGVAFEIAMTATGLARRLQRLRE